LFDKEAKHYFLSILYLSYLKIKMTAALIFQKLPPIKILKSQMSLPEA